MTSSATLSSTFSTSFKFTKLSIESLLTPPTSPSALTEAATQLATLRQGLTEATAFLASYDQRRYEEEWKLLKSTLDSLRPPSSKPKFAFKGLKPSPPTAPAPPPPAPTPPLPSLPTPSVSSTSSTSHALTTRQNAYLPSPPTSSEPYSLTLSDLTGCLVDLLPSDGTEEGGLTALYAEGLKGCVVLAPRVGGSVMLSRLEGCLIIVGCQQFRIHDSQNCTILLDIPSHPIIERSSLLRFGALPPSLPGVPLPTSKHLEVQDFNHLHPTPSPNWSIYHPTTTAQGSDSGSTWERRGERAGLLEGEEVGGVVGGLLRSFGVE